MAGQAITQSSERPAAQPAYVLRGHSAQVHAVHFLRGNTRLLTGDASGWVVLWSTCTKRARAVWKAHANTVLHLNHWHDQNIVSHGRDGRIHVWQLPEAHEARLSHILPLEPDAAAAAAAAGGAQPWLLHSLRVNAVTFCSLAMCHALPGAGDLPSDGVLLATPGVHDGHIDITSLPGEDRCGTIPSPPNESTGMVMAIGLTFGAHDRRLLVLGGYESGHVCVWAQQHGRRQWQLTYTHKTHAQPVMSLGIAPRHQCFFTSSADALVGRHPLGPGTPPAPAKTVQTKHAGQQGLAVRDDGTIFATAGWDARVRVYSVRTMKELAVLKWHREGCYALAFATTAAAAAGPPSGEPTAAPSAVAKPRMTVAQQRAHAATTTHFLAVGAKDGKVSLWDIY